MTKSVLRDEDSEMKQTHFYEDSLLPPTNKKNALDGSPNRRSTISPARKLPHTHNSSTNAVNNY
jgi:hypothetical protein